MFYVSIVNGLNRSSGLECSVFANVKNLQLVKKGNKYQGCL